MDIEDKEFLALIQYANEEELGFLIIGGFAMNLHGLKRFTEDVDLWLEPTNDNKLRLIKVLVKMGFTEEELDDVAALDFREYVVFSALGFIDFLTIVHRNLDYYECFKISQSHKLSNNSNCRFLHINHLRESKILAHRHQDLRDVLMIDDLLKTKN